MFAQSTVRILICAGAVFLPGISAAQGPDPNAPRHPEQLLVRFEPQTDALTRLGVHATVAALPLREYRHVPGLVLVKVPPDRLSESLNAYRQSPYVRYAEPDYLAELEAIPNDPHFSNLWGLDNTGQTIGGYELDGTTFSDPGSADADIDAAEAWDLWQGEQNFLVAVIDGGVNYNHVDLVDNIWTNPVEVMGDANTDGCPGVCAFDDDADGQIDEIPEFLRFGPPWWEEPEWDDDENGWVDDIHGYDTMYDPSLTVPDTFPPLDDQLQQPVGHGTGVASVIAGRGNNGQGVVGVNWRGRIVVLKICAGSGACPTSATVEAMHYVMENNIKVSNNSYTRTTFSQCEYDAIQAA